MESLETQLAQLESAQLVRRLSEEDPSAVLRQAQDDSSGQGLAYWFKHNLTQEMAYESLLLKKRREVHRRVAEAYETLYAGSLDENAALLAQHYAEAGDEVKTIEYATRAGDVSDFWNLMLLHVRIRTRLRTARQYGEQSLAIARTLNLREQEAYDLNDLSLVYVYLGEYERGLAALLQARAHWKETDNLPMLTDSFGSVVLIYLARGEYDAAIEASHQAFDLSAQIGNRWGEAYSQTWVGTAYFEKGEIAHPSHPTPRLFCWHVRASLWHIKTLTTPTPMPKGCRLIYAAHSYANTCLGH